MATTTFDNLITFSRGSNATVTGPNGLIQWAPNNLVTFSEQFNSWGLTNSTVTANSSIAPDGTTTADALYETAVTATFQAFSNSVSFTAGVYYAYSVYAKAGTNSFIQLSLASAAFSTTTFANFDLVNGVVGTFGGNVTSASIQPTGNGWYRCVMVAPAVSTASTTAAICLTQSASAARSPSYAGSTSNFVSIWGAQVELGSTATTYNNTSVRNLLGFSEAFDNAAWTKTGASIVTGAQANPVNNLFNAQKLMEDTSSATVHRAYATPACVANTPYTFSAYVKAAGRTQVRLLETTLLGAIFDLSSGTVVSTDAGVTASIAAAGNGWYRCRITVTTGAAQTLFVAQIQSATGGSPTYTGDGNSGVYIYGAMLSNSASLDPYVPTPGAAPSSTAYYGPRFDYDPVTLAARGLLIEEQRANLVLYSQDFANASWAKSSATVTSDTTTAPDGTATADTLVPSSSISGVVERSVTFTGDGDKSVSIFLKAGTSTLTYLFIRDTTVPATRGRALITWTGGVPSVTADSGGTIQGVDSFANGWYRIRLLAPSVVAANSNAFRIQPDAAVGTGTVIAWGAQAENGAFATSYIPTIASTVTRSADVATITGSLFSQWYNQPAGGFVVEADTGRASGYGSIICAGLDANNRNDIGVIATSGYQSVQVGGVEAASWNNLNAINVSKYANGAAAKSALAYQTDNANAAVNGTAGTADTSCAIPSPSELRIGTDFSSRLLNGHIRSIRYVPVRAADFQLQQVTT